MIATTLFAADTARSELEDQLLSSGIEFEELGWDWYDCSLEIRGVPNDLRLSEESQRVIHAAGFAKVYVNHIDGWETHYHWKGPFSVSEGWRVNYHWKRKGSEDKSIWVEAIVPNWPDEWFEHGYCKVVTTALGEKEGGK